MFFPETVGIQLAERVLPANEVVEEDASSVASRTVGMVSLRGATRTDFLLPAVFHGAKIGLEIPMRLPNSGEQGSGPFDQELQSRDAIQDHAPEQHGVQRALVVVLDQHVQVVPKIQVGLERTDFLQRSSSKVEDHRLSTRANSVPSVLQSPAQVNFLHVGEKIFVQASHFAPCLGLNEQRGSRGPKHLAVGIVLPSIGFKNLENASCTECEPIAVNESTSSACVFE